MLVYIAQAKLGLGRFPATPFRVFKSALRHKFSFSKTIWNRMLQESLDAVGFPHAILEQTHEAARDSSRPALKETRSKTVNLVLGSEPESKTSAVRGEGATIYVEFKRRAQVCPKSRPTRESVTGLTHCRPWPRNFRH